MAKGRDGYKPRKCLLWKILTIFLLGGSLATTLPAADYQVCRDCHETTLSLEQARNYLHSPFALETCGKCHELQVSSTAQNKDTAKGPDTQKQSTEKITWLVDSNFTSHSHAFLLPENDVGSKLIVEFHGDQGQTFRKEVDVPSFETLEKPLDTGTPPDIMEPRVLEVEYGIFLSATIEWRTDVLADAEVQYGINDLSQVAKVEKRLSNHHRVILNELQPKKNYQFKVVSRDLFGRVQASEVNTFSTHSAYEYRVDKENQNDNFEDGILETEFSRIDDKYLIDLNYDASARIFLGSSGERQTAVADGSLPETDEVHAGLSDLNVTSIQACRKCHQGPSTATHPVNVLPKPGMIIPPEYPTLPDGRITCGSCHEAHAADYDYLTRKRGKRELCVGCHKDMI